MPADAEILTERSVAAANQLTLTGYTSNYVTSINMDASRAGRVFCKLLPSSGPAIHTKLHDSSTSVVSTALLLIITMINNKNDNTNDNSRKLTRLPFRGSNDRRKQRIVVITFPIRVPSHLGDAHADTRAAVRAEAEHRVGDEEEEEGGRGDAHTEARLSAAQSE